MQVSFEILDHIFSFLVSHRQTLVACSKDPFLFPVVERHLYNHIVVHITRGGTDSDVFEPHVLSKLVAKNPRILYHVRNLQIHVEIKYSRVHQQAVIMQMNEFAKTLLMFPALESILLTTSGEHAWYWSDDFRAALEDRLNLPTVKSVHFVGSDSFPFSILDNCQNVRNLSLSGPFLSMAYGPFRNSSLPQLKSLNMFVHFISSELLAWLKPRIKRLQSLKYKSWSSVDLLSQLLGSCSTTLVNLEIDLTNSEYFSKYASRTGAIRINPLPELSPIPPNLQQLTLRTAVELEHDGGCRSNLPAAANAISLFISSLRHLIIDIGIRLHGTIADLTKVDFSALAVLGAASLSIPRIDLYIHTSDFPSDLTRAQLFSSLHAYKDVMRSIEEGALIIHSEETAPDCVFDIHNLGQPLPVAFFD